MKLAHQLCAFALLTASAVHADVTSPILSGYQRLTMLGNSDTVVSLPFARTEAASGLVQSVAAGKVTFKGTPGFQASQFVVGGAQTDTFYAIVESGAKEGSAYLVTANDATSVTVDLDGDSLSTVVAGDRVAIIPFWTLGTLFPNGAGVNESPTVGNRATELLMPDFNATGINSSPAAVYFYFGGHWLKVGDGTNPHDSDTLFPDAHFVVRQNVATSTELVCSGQVLPSKLTLIFGVNAASKRDNFLGLQRPTAVTLAGSGLVSSGAFASSPTPGNRTDELLTFDNTLAMKNKSPSSIYYYWNSAWRKVGAGAATFDTATIFTPGTGFIIRKNVSAAAPSWTNTPNY